MADRSSAPKGALITGLVLILLAFGGCGYGCTTVISFAGELADTLDGVGSTPVGQPTTFTAPGDAAMIFTTSAGTDCRVEGPGSVDLQGPPAGTDSNVELDGRNLTFRYVFETDQGSEYRVVCGDEISGGDGEYFVAPFPGFTRILTGLAGVGIGALFFLVGAILVIVGLVRRSKWKKQHSTGYGPPPSGGYGPPPSGPSAPPPSGGYGPPPSGPSAPPPGMPPPPGSQPPGSPLPPPAGGAPPMPPSPGGPAPGGPPPMGPPPGGMPPPPSPPGQ